MSETYSMTKGGETTEKIIDLQNLRPYLLSQVKTDQSSNLYHIRA